MFEGLRIIVLSMIATTLVGGILGLLVGVLIGQPLIGLGLGGFFGANFGMVLGYGFLPESPADHPMEPEGDA